VTEPAGGSGEPGETNYVAAGRVVRAHGIRGKLRVVPDIDSPGEALTGREVYLYAGQEPDPGDPEWRPCKVEAVKETAGSCLIKIEGLHDRNEAERFTGCFLFVEKSGLPALSEGRFYAWRLCDMEARTESGGTIGRIRDVLDLPAQPLLVIEADSGREVLVPFHREFVRSVDEESGLVFLADASGLLEPSEPE
jgi:16S rRNA processing protein RimM